MSGINRAEALTWSRERITVEINNLWQEISEYEREADELQDDLEEEEEKIRSGRRSDKHADAMSTAIGQFYNIITQKELDIKFLKRLSNSTAAEKAEIAAELRKQAEQEAEWKRKLQEQEERRRQQERVVTQPIPRGRPIDKDTGDYIYRARARLEQNRKLRWVEILGWDGWLLALMFIGLVVSFVIWLFLTSPTLKSDNSYFGEKPLLSREWKGQLFSIKR